MLSLLPCLLNIKFLTTLFVILHNFFLKRPSKLYKRWVPQNLDLLSYTWFLTLQLGLSRAMTNDGAGVGGWCVHIWAMVSQGHAMAVDRDLWHPPRGMRISGTGVAAVWSRHPSNFEILALYFIKCSFRLPVLQAFKAFV